jgi:microsomal dipeptidase-like Zn-dependent dipeptidase
MTVDTIEAEASQIASDPDTLRQFLAVHSAVRLLIDHPREDRDAAAIALRIKDAP